VYLYGAKNQGHAHRSGKNQQLLDFRISHWCDDVVSYLDLTANQELPDDWHDVEDRLPKLAALVKAYVNLPVASVDAECSFSKYGLVLSAVSESVNWQF